MILTELDLEILRKLLARNAFGSNHYRIETIERVGLKAHLRGEERQSVERLIKIGLLQWYKRSKGAVQIKDDYLEENATILGNTMTELTLASPTFFVKYLGSVPTIKALDFLMQNRKESWCMKEIAEQGGVAYASLKIALPLLMLRNLIVIDRKVGKIAFYRINTAHAIVKKLHELDRLIMEQEIGRTVHAKTTILAR